MNMYDYWFSAKHEEQMIEMSKGLKRKNAFRVYGGVPFTDMTVSGFKPPPNFDDYQLIGTGDGSLAQYEIHLNYDKPRSLAEYGYNV